MSESEIQKNFRLGAEMAEHAIAENVEQLDTRYLHYLGELIAKELRRRDREQRPMTKAVIDERYQSMRPPRFKWGKGVLRHLGETLQEEPLRGPEPDEHEEGDQAGRLPSPEWLQEMHDWIERGRDKAKRDYAKAQEDIRRQRAARERARLKYLELQQKIADEKDSAKHAPIEEDKHEDYHEPMIEREMQRLRKQKERDASRAGARAEEEESITTDAPSGLEKRVTYIEEVVEKLREKTERLRISGAKHFSDIRGWSIDALRLAKENEAVLELHRSKIKELSDQLGEIEGELQHAATRDDLDKLRAELKMYSHRRAFDVNQRMNDTLKPLHERVDALWKAATSVRDPELGQRGVGEPVHALQRIVDLEAALMRENSERETLRERVDDHSQRLQMMDEADELNEEAHKDIYGQAVEETKRLLRKQAWSTDGAIGALRGRVEKLEGQMLQGDGVLASREWLRGQARREEVYALKQAINLVAGALGVKMDPYRLTLAGYLNQIGPPPKGEQ